MMKLLICLVSGLLLAGIVLQLRQQRLNLHYQTHQLHNQIEDRQARLWNQQLQIAIYTAPNAIAKTVGNHELKVVPRTPLRTGRASWIDVSRNPDAE
jgi:cell division protein FtsL